MAPSETRAEGQGRVGTLAWQAGRGDGGPGGDLVVEGARALLDKGLGWLVQSFSARSLSLRRTLQLCAVRCFSRSIYLFLSCTFEIKTQC